ncbi:MAG: tungsten formylmethanofuran dehydrogenase [Saprospiraceae bacterium]|nr:tungsten formylmethanofuran dehydrogenase [Saprospiraceae bacterium]MBK6564176.1 tungsten formylmethanofuran dehydrogenase [Saprospiraceae bacterium]MBK7524146.1 tungsten formylmethanofuran dehydrogenase [Saprospiraceae bacterium]MBK8078874.1 tungsten formylmethanofuran dehydrogenase [Saprospiraceae bacterium]MBK8372196.1 tungsten formylmethanofuran dehydrogenase [Saprospiraceae bacterium]
MNQKIDKTILWKAFTMMCKAKALTQIYEENTKWVSKYVHATSRGHEAVQIALGLQLTPKDYVAPYYRDDALLLSIGMKPYELMLQVLAKKDDPFSGGRTYYCHPSLRDEDKPKIPHQSSATGMQAIPTTGIAMGLQYKENTHLPHEKGAIAVCSIGDAAMTEGEIAEALQMAALKQFPILYFVQDNEWDISATAKETRAMNAAEYAKGFPGIEAISIDGSDFSECFVTLEYIIQTIRKERRPFLLHAKVPLLNHHTSGVRKEWYRDDLEEDMKSDPFPKMVKLLLENGFSKTEMEDAERKILEEIRIDLENAKDAADPKPEDLFTFDFVPTPIVEEKGIREPKGGAETVMVDSALVAVQELMEDHPECLLYGQDVGARLGGVFREAATLAHKFGDFRVFNTPIQEAFIVGSTVGMSAVGLKPIVEVQFADYIWPGLNQLFTEVSRSCYLSNGKWPVSMVLRVPIGAYGSGGPFHSSSVESVLTNIRGIKIVYPSNGADFKGLLKAAYYDPNPVVILEHKGLYWSKVKGTETAKRVLPSRDYILPLGIADMTQEASEKQINKVLIVTYGMGVHWALNASKDNKDQVGILDLRTLFPLDTDLIFKKVSEYNKILVLTEEPVHNTFAQSLAGRIQENCFFDLDAPVMVIGSENLPAIPLNEILEKTMLPSVKKIKDSIHELLLF